MGTIAIHSPDASKVKSYSGDLRFVLGTLLFPSSYPAGGVNLDLATSHPGLAQIVRSLFMPPLGGRVSFWNAVTKKLQVFTSPGVETTDDLSVLGPVPFLAVTV
jgi:hypothetical protein